MNKLKMKNMLQSMCETDKFNIKVCTDYGKEYCKRTCDYAYYVGALIKSRDALKNTQNILIKMYKNGGKNV